MQYASPLDKIIVYQIFTRLFGNLNTANRQHGSIEDNGVGKFNDVNQAALESLKEFGVTHLWFTGVIAHATQTDYSDYGLKADHPAVVKGKAGSPYAIKDYYDVDPDLAVEVDHRMKEFEDLIKRTHEAGLKTLIDFVPNHVARQYASTQKPYGVEDFGETDDKSVHFTPQNNFYYLPNVRLQTPTSAEIPYEEFPAKASGNDVFHASPSINDWYETIKLNYGVDYLNQRKTHFDPIPSTWKKMREILLYWAEKGVDGFRCDMAEMVPVEFWGWVIPQVQDRFPDLIFIAEIYTPAEYPTYLFKGHFTYLYDKVGLYDALRRLIEGHGSAEDITTVWQRESGNFSNRMLRFLENHDEQRIASTYFAGDPFAAVPAMVLSATLHSGPWMIYFGQELGVNPTDSEGFQGNDGRTTIFDYWGIPEFQRWVNQHTYDGGQLLPQEKKLRSVYQWINYFIRQNEAVYSGEFHDLQYLNAYGQTPNYYGHRVYSYLRFTKNQVLLFVYNFDKQTTFDTYIKISQGVWENTLNLSSSDTYSLCMLSPAGKHKTLKIEPNTIFEQGIPVHLTPTSFAIFEIKR